MSSGHVQGDDRHELYGTDPNPIGIRHEDHVDYLQHGHLHHIRADGTVEEHTIPISERNPAGCTPAHDCGGHPAEHRHGPDCGHPAVPHGGHIDYLVDGHLHHPHDDHCDDHGPVDIERD